MDNYIYSGSWHKKLHDCLEDTYRLLNGDRHKYRFKPFLYKKWTKAGLKYIENDHSLSRCSYYFIFNFLGGKLAIFSDKLDFVVDNNNYRLNINEDISKDNIIIDNTIYRLISELNKLLPKLYKIHDEIKSLLEEEKYKRELNAEKFLSGLKDIFK